MVTMLMRAGVGALVICSGSCGAGETERSLQDAVTQVVDISVRPRHANRLPDCRLSGDVIVWVDRPVKIVDESGNRLGAIRAGLAQFGANARLERCVPDGGVVDLAHRFANIVIADDGPWRGGTFGTSEARGVASLLADDFYRLEDGDGTAVPLVEGIRMGAIGSTAYRFVIVLIRGAHERSIDAVISRETLRTKFSPRLQAADRNLSRLKWSSVD